MNQFSSDLQKKLSKSDVRHSVTRALFRVFVAFVNNNNKNNNNELWQDLWRPDFPAKFDKPEKFIEFCQSLSEKPESVDGSNLDELTQCFQKTDIPSVMDFYGISEGAFFHLLDNETRDIFTRIVDQGINSFKEMIRSSKDFSENSRVSDTARPVALFASGGPSESAGLDVVDRVALASCLTLPSDILNIYCMAPATGS